MLLNFLFNFNTIKNNDFIRKINLEFCLFGFYRGALNSLIELKLTTLHYTGINNMIDHITPLRQKGYSLQ
ncbi:Uncharacterized protein XB16_2373 [Leptospira santarosai]|uniref:Uncharacterized protein n=1 Tax=Leptospira santarosai TaxID=28183 RepID=A0A2P1QUV6_9LEPT|nr:Uncharacterized protein XB16_2373 [Leptospira santarosai]